MKAFNVASRLSRHNFCAFTLMLSVLMASQVSAQGLGRLFFTPQERQALQQQGRVPSRVANTRTVLPEALTVDAGLTRSQSVEKKAKMVEIVNNPTNEAGVAPPEKSQWVWNGYVQRDDGLQTVWINGSLFYWHAPAKSNQVPAPQVTLADGRKVMLKVGQLYDPYRQVIYDYPSMEVPRAQAQKP